MDSQLRSLGITKIGQRARIALALQSRAALSPMPQAAGLRVAVVCNSSYFAGTSYGGAVRASLALLREIRRICSSSSGSGTLEIFALLPRPVPEALAFKLGSRRIGVLEWGEERVWVGKPEDLQPLLGSGRSYHAVISLSIEPALVGFAASVRGDRHWALAHNYCACPRLEPAGGPPPDVHGRPVPRLARPTARHGARADLRQTLSACLPTLWHTVPAYPPGRPAALRPVPPLRGGAGARRGTLRARRAALPVRALSCLHAAVGPRAALRPASVRRRLPLPTPRQWRRQWRWQWGWQWRWQWRRRRAPSACRHAAMGAAAPLRDNGEPCLDIALDIA